MNEGALTGCATAPPKQHNNILDYLELHGNQLNMLKEVIANLRTKLDRVMVGDTIKAEKKEEYQPPHGSDVAQAIDSATHSLVQSCCELREIIEAIDL